MDRLDISKKTHYNKQYAVKIIENFVEKYRRKYKNMPIILYELVVLC